MSHEKEISAVISGSFKKFKPEIDRTIDAFTELGVTVRAPKKGWLYLPPTQRYNTSALDIFRPLPSEIGMSLKEVEDDFLQSISTSDLLYIVNPENFIGDSASFEMGFAFAKRLPVYSQKKISPDADFTINETILIANIRACTPEEVVYEIKERKQRRNNN